MNRRRLALGLAIVALVAVIVPVGANRWLDGQFQVVEGHVSKVPGQVSVESGFGDEPETALVAYRHGEEYLQFVSLLNRGGDVRITGFPGEAPHVHALLHRVEVRVIHDPLVFRRFDSELDHSVVFKPFTLKHDEEVWVYFRSRFSDCEFFGHGSQWGMSSLDVRVKKLWSSRTVSVPLRQPFAVAYGALDGPFPETVLGPGCTG